MSLDWEGGGGAAHQPPTMGSGGGVATSNPKRPGGPRSDNEPLMQPPLAL